MEDVDDGTQPNQSGIHPSERTRKDDEVNDVESNRTRSSDEVEILEENTVVSSTIDVGIDMDVVGENITERSGVNSVDKVHSEVIDEKVDEVVISKTGDQQEQQKEHVRETHDVGSNNDEGIADSSKTDKPTIFHNDNEDQTEKNNRKRNY